MNLVNEKEREERKTKSLMAAQQQASEISSQATTYSQQGNKDGLLKQIEVLRDMAARAAEPQQQTAILGEVSRLQNLIPATEQKAVNNSVSAVRAIDEQLKRDNITGPPRPGDERQVRKQILNDRRNQLMANPDVAEAYQAKLDKARKEALGLAGAELDVEEKRDKANQREIDNSVNALMAIDQQLKTDNTSGQVLPGDPRQMRTEMLKARRNQLMENPQIAREYQVQVDKERTAALELASKELTLAQKQEEAKQKVISQDVGRLAMAMADNPNMVIPEQYARYEKEIKENALALQRVREEHRNQGPIDPIPQDILDAAGYGAEDNPIAQEALKKYKNQDWVDRSGQQAIYDALYKSAEGYVSQRRNQEEDLANAKAEIKVNALVNLSKTGWLVNLIGRGDLWQEFDGIDDDDPRYATLLEVAKQNPEASLEQYGSLVLTALDEATKGKMVDVPSEKEAMALPSGTRFRLPDGRTGTKQ